MLERRKEQRWPAYLGGKIAFSKRFAVADCLVRNTSGAGAKLVIHNAGFIPDEFDLTIPNKNTEYHVRARWRRFDEIGVEIAPVQKGDTVVSLALARRLKKLERENASLRRRVAEWSEG